MPTKNQQFVITRSSQPKHVNNGPDDIKRREALEMYAAVQEMKADRDDDPLYYDESEDE